MHKSMLNHINLSDTKSAQRWILSGWSYLLVVLFILLPPQVNSKSLRIQLIYNNTDKTHQTYIATLKHELGQRIAAIEYIDSSATHFARGTSLTEADYYVSIGVESAVNLQNAHLAKPTLYALLPIQHVPDNSVQPTQACHPDCIYSVLDQPLKRQLTLLRHALPDIRHIGVLYGAQNTKLIDPLRKYASAEKFDLLAVKHLQERTLLENLTPILERAQLLLALPEIDIYNRQTARSILLTTYRRGIPIFGYSEAYTRAGALLSLHSTPEDFARHNAEILSGLIQGQKNQQRLIYPKYFNVSVNQTVAKSLNISIDNGDSLTNWLRNNDDINTNH